MGKTNKANRTKGNTRPSSSGHSAQLLGVDGRALTGFIGFDALDKEIPSYVPVTGQHTADATDNTVDSDFRMVMRKMLKRDAVTRLKAMQEFGEHCIEKEKDIVKNVLPFWPRLFNKLALDTDRRIREATHQANGKLLSKVKREMAPYLKNIMGVWLLGQCDLYAPAASAAQTIFTTTFPTNKQSEALIFCKNEIFSYFKDNLFEQTAKTMSEPSLTTPEDMENKYILVISSTLQAMKLFLTTVPKNELETIHDYIYQVVAENKFWKFAKNKEAQIRGSWYSLLSSLCQLKPDVFKEMEKKLAITVFSCLSESDPMVAPAVWESALSIVVNFENCWQGVDIHKVALPQLWTLLKEGGKGNASVLFPCLLPFLSKLPKEIVETEHFILQFFSCLKQSLMLQSVKLSASECDAILAAYFESLQYICCVRLGSEKIGPEVLQKIISNEVIPILESSLYQENSSHLAASKLYILVGSLIMKLECLSCETDKGTSEAFTTILSNFWQEMLPITSKIFAAKGKYQLSSLVYLAFLFNSILQPSDSFVKLPKRTVRFKEEEDYNEEEEPVKKDIPLVERTPRTEPAVVALNKKSQSFNHVLKFAEILCEQLETNCQQGYLQLLEELLGSAASRDFVMGLVQVFSEKKSYNSGSALGFVEKVVLKWLREVEGDEECLSCAFNIVFIICSFVPEGEAKNILNCCCTLQVSHTELMLKRGLGAYRDKPFFLNWLKTSTWSSQLVSGLQQLMAEDKFYGDNSSILEIQVYQRMLQMCLQDAYTSVLIPDKSFEDVIKLLSDLAKQAFTRAMTIKRVDLALYFIHDVFIAVLKNSQICWKFQSTGDFVYQLFHINLHDVPLLKCTDAVSKILFEILDTFVESYVEAKDEIMNESSLIYKIAKELNSSIHSLKSHEEALCVQRHCLSLLASVQKYLAIHKPNLNSTLFVSYKLMDAILPSSHTWDSLTEELTISILPSFLKKKIFYPLLMCEKLSYPEDSVLKFSLACSVVSGILCSEYMASSEGEDSAKFHEHYINEHFLQFLWCLTFNNGLKTTDEFKTELLTKGLENNCLKMLSVLPDEDVNKLKQKLFDLSLLDEDWALCLQTLYEILPSCNLESLADKEFDGISNEWPGLHKYVVRQVLIHHLSIEKKKVHLKELLHDLVKLKDVTDKNFAGKMGELCCYLQDKSIVLYIDVQDFLKQLFETIINYDFVENASLKFMYHLQMIHILSCEIQYGFCILSPSVWDFFLSLLPVAVEECRSKTFDTPKDLMLLYHTVTIFSSLSELLKMINVNLHDAEPDWMPAPISSQSYEEMVHLFIHVAGIFNVSKPLPEMCEVVLSKFLEAVTFIPSDNLVSMLKLQDPESRLNLNSDNSVLNGLISSLSCPVRQVQFASHTLLLKLMPTLPLVLSDELKSQCSGEDDSEEDIVKIPYMLSPLIEQLKHMNELVESMLLDVKIGDLCTVVPHTDSYTFAMAYLLAWIEMLEFISASPSQIRLGYATHLEEMKLLSTLFSNVFRFMPENPILCLKKGLKLESPKKDDLKLLFIKPPQLNSVSPSSEEIQSIACYVFSTALRTVPASIRTWWNNLDRKSADIVNNFTSKYASGLLCTAEIQAVHENEKQFENLMVQARPGSREVIATYTIDDCAIELCVQLPINYPLGPISAERRGKVVIGQLEWRHWLMQLTTVLTYQNGSILDGLTIWKRNLDKKFEGVEECMICYYILHNSTLKMPKLSCHVCRKKFHSTCLYKWFRTSNNFTCPLCRNEFKM